MNTEVLVLLSVFCGLVGGGLIGAAFNGDFSKSYPADFIPGPKFRAGKSHNPEE